MKSSIHPRLVDFLNLRIEEDPTSSSYKFDGDKLWMALMLF